MADRKEIIDAVESFYIDIIERYKDLERQIAGETRILTMFRKVDYKSRISKLKDFKKKVQNVNLKKIKIDEDDELAAEVRDKLGIAYSLFVKLIDAQVSCQTFLYKKSEGEKKEITRCFSTRNPDIIKEGKPSFFIRIIK